MAQFMRTAAPMGDWRSLPFTVSVSAGLAHGDLYLLEDTVGVIFIGEPVLDANGCAQPLVAAYGTETTLLYHCEKIVVAKEIGSVFNPGDKVYWDGVTGHGVENFDTGNYWIGIALEAKLAADLTVKIDLKGDKATLLE